LMSRSRASRRSSRCCASASELEAREAFVVEQAPDREHRVQVGLVGVDGPVPLGEGQAAVHHEQRLFAGGQGEGALAAFVVVEVVGLALVVEQQREASGAVEQDHALSEVARLGLREGVRRAHADADTGRLLTQQEASLLGLSNPVAVGDQRCRAPLPAVAQGVARRVRRAGDVPCRGRDARDDRAPAAREGLLIGHGMDSSTPLRALRDPEPAAGGMQAR
jgi:hypothetical protein